MVMRMLDAGGFPVVCPPDRRGTSYEDGRALLFDGSECSGSWLVGATGAVKLLDPQRFRLPETLRQGSRAIWLARNPVEQAKSQMKFLSILLGLRVNASERKRLVKSLRDDEPKALAALPPTRLFLRFEEVLAEPLVAARAIASFVGPLDCEAMAAVVARRAPECAADMSQEFELIRTLPSQRKEGSPAK